MSPKPRKPWDESRVKRDGGKFSRVDRNSTSRPGQTSGYARWDAAIWKTDQEAAHPITNKGNAGASAPRPRVRLRRRVGIRVGAKGRPMRRIHGQGNAGATYSADRSASRAAHYARMREARKRLARKKNAMLKALHEINAKHEANTSTRPPTKIQDNVAEAVNKLLSTPGSDTHAGQAKALEMMSQSTSHVEKWAAKQHKSARKWSNKMSSVTRRIHNLRASGFDFDSLTDEEAAALAFGMPLLAGASGGLTSLGWEEAHTLWAGRLFTPPPPMVSSTEALLAAITRNPTFEAKHPRGGDGRFLEKGGWVKWIADGIWRVGQVQDIDPNGNVHVVGLGDRPGDAPHTLSHRSLFLAEAPVAHLDKNGKKLAPNKTGGPKETVDVTKWKKVGAQAGSNTGGFYEDQAGVKWYVKWPASDQHAANEQLMNRLYAAVGAPSPETRRTADGKVFASRIEDSEGWGSLSGQDLVVAQEAIAEDFVTDAWLYNWDAPKNSENIRITPSGQALRVDSGGAGMFRARGSKRKLETPVTELQSLLGSSAGRAAYAKATDAVQRENAKRILAVSPETIKRMVAEEGLPSALSDNLVARRQWLAAHYGLTLPENTPEGKKLLERLATSPDDLTAAEKKDISKVIAGPPAARVRTPDGPGELKVGAMVWVNNRNPANKAKRPITGDRGTITAVYPADPTIPGDTGTFEITSYDGKKSSFFTADEFMVLRDNGAAPAAVMKSGEHPDLGDRVELLDGRVGSVSELYPMFAKVKLDDGTFELQRINKLSASKIAAPDGSAHPANPASPTVPAMAAPGGTPKPKNRKQLIADLGDPVDPADFKVGEKYWSVQHGVRGMLVQYDTSTQKATVMFGHAVVVVQGNKLYPEDVSKGDAVAALREFDRVAADAKAAAPGTPTAAKPKTDPLDPKVLAALPEVEVAVPAAVKRSQNAIDTVKIKPGDRALVLHAGQSQDIMLVLRTDGQIEVVDAHGFGSLNGNTMLESMLDESYTKSLNAWQIDYPTLAVMEEIANGGDGKGFKDITPGKYKAAAAVLGPDETKLLDALNHSRSVKVEIVHGLPYRNVAVKLEHDPATGITTVVRDDTAKLPGAKPIEAQVDLAPGDRIFRIDGSDTSKGDVEIVYEGHLVEEDNLSSPYYDKTWGPGQPKPYWVGHEQKVRRSKIYIRRQDGSWEDAGFNGENIKSRTKISDSTLIDDLEKTKKRSYYSSGGRYMEEITPRSTKAATVLVYGSSERWATREPGYKPFVSQDLPGSHGMRPAPGSSTQLAARQPLDVEDRPGMATMQHSLGTSRKRLNSGELDDLIEKATGVATPRKVVGVASNGKEILLDSDGRKCLDPAMNDFAAALEGDQLPLVLDSVAFDAFRKKSPVSASLYRGVNSTEDRQNMETGDLFTGLGVYGNGHYSTTNRDTSLRSYARGNVNGVSQLCIRPGANIPENNKTYRELSADQAADLEQAAVEIDDAYTAAFGAPSRADIEAAAHRSGEDVSIAAANAWETWLTSQGLGVKANRVLGGYPDFRDSVNLDVTNPKTGVTTTLEFHRVSWSQSSGGSVKKLYGKKSYVLRVTHPKDQAGRKLTSHGLMIAPSGTSFASSAQQYMPALHAALDGAVPSINQTAVARAATLHARFKFIADFGRWAIAAGYDAYSIPQSGEVYWVITHRAAQVFKKHPHGTYSV